MVDRGEIRSDVNQEFPNKIWLENNSKRKHYKTYKEFPFIRGLRKLAWRHLGYGIQEMYKGIYINAQVKQLQRFVPILKSEDVTRSVKLPMVIVM